MASEQLIDGSQHHEAGTAYRIIRAMFVVLFFWIFWKFGGYLITAAVVRMFGSSVETDAYFFTTQTVVYVMVFAPALGILVPAFMPVFIDERSRRGEEAAWRFAGTVFTLVLGAGVAMVAAMYLWAAPITDTLVGGFPGETRAVGVRMLGWLMPGAALMMLFLVLRCLLNSYKIFSYPSAAEAAQKGVWLVVILIGASAMGIQSAALGLLIGSVAMVAIAASGLRDKLALIRLGFSAMSRSRAARELLVIASFVVLTGGFLYLSGRLLPARFSAYRDVVLMTVALLAVLLYCAMLWRRAKDHSGAMARFALLAVPLGISAFFATYREVVTRHFQSFSATGVYSDIEGAKKIVNFPTELIALALSVAMLPYLCELATRRNKAMLGDIVTKAIRLLAVGFVPLTVLTLVLADPIVRLVLDRGDRALVHIEYTALALQITAAALVIYAAERVIMQAFISLQRVWPPALLGIAATLFQVGFLLVAVHLLRMDYPTQIFYLVVIAYPLSRTLKNFFMLIWLRRYVDVLPVKSTMIFSCKLIALSLVVGGVAWGVLRGTASLFPFDSYRQKKVVIDNFEAVPETWYSVDADSITVASGPMPGDAAAVFMAYRQHRAHGRDRDSHHVRLERDLAHVDVAGADSLEFRVWAKRSPGNPMVALHYADGTTVDTSAGQASAGRWSECRARLSKTSSLVSFDLYFTEPPDGDSNEVFVNGVRFVSSTDGTVLWSEDFERNGWQTNAAPAAVAAVPGSGGVGSERYALRVPKGSIMTRATKSLVPYELSTTESLRCNLLNDGREPINIGVSILTKGSQSPSVQKELPPGEWTRLTVGRSNTGHNTSAEEWKTATAVQVTIPAGEGSVWIDDVTVRREPNVRYELLKLIHCAAPSVAGIVVLVAGLVLLRFEELGYVVQWVRDRGWRRQKVDAGGAGNGLD